MKNVVRETDIRTKWEKTILIISDLRLLFIYFFLIILAVLKHVYKTV